jgi:hypothetical protein
MTTSAPQDYFEPGLSIPPNLTARQIAAAFNLNSSVEGGRESLDLEGFLYALAELTVDDDDIQAAYDCQDALAESLRGWFLPADLIGNPAEAIGALLLAARRDERRLLENRNTNARDCQDALVSWLHRSGQDLALLRDPDLAMLQIHYAPRLRFVRRLLRFLGLGA